MGDVSLLDFYGLQGPIFGVGTYLSLLLISPKLGAPPIYKAVGDIFFPLFLRRGK